MELMIRLLPALLLALAQVDEDQTLHWRLLNAIEIRDVNAVRKALAAGAVIQVTTCDGSSALELAARSTPEIVRLILERKPSVDALSAGLVLAAADGSLEIVRLLLDAGARPNVRAKHALGQTPLQHALGSGRRDLVQLLLDRGADVQYTDVRGNTPLMTAAFRETPDLARLLLDKGARIDAQNNEGATALHGAMEYYFRKDTILLLLERGADPTLRDRNERDAAHFAQAKKDADVTAAIEQARSGPAGLERTRRQAALIDAIKAGNRDAIAALLKKGGRPPDEALFLAEAADDGPLIQLLLDHGGWINARDAQRNSLLSTALTHRRFQIARDLVERGAQRGASSWGGLYPAAAAVQTGDREMVGFLLKEGANLSVNTNFMVGPKRYSSPAALAREMGREDLVDLLLKAGDRLPWRSQKHGGPLLAAVAKGDTETAKKLIEDGEDLYARDGSQRTPFALAVELGHEEIQKALRGKGVDPREGMEIPVPLQNAADRGDLAVVRRLIDAGADPNGRMDPWGETPLMKAAVRGHVEVVRFLVDHGADLFALSNGRCALEMAQGNVVKFLLDHGAILKGPYPGTTALLIAAAAGDLQKTRAFLERGESLGAVDRNNRNALYLAAAGGHVEVAALLLEKGAVFRKRPGITLAHPVLLAFPAGNVELLRVFLKHRTDPDMRLTRGETWFPGTTLLGVAAVSAQPELVKTLLDAGADINAADDEGHTPLILVAACSVTPAFAKEASKRGGYAPVARLLIERGAKLDMKDKSGQTALDYAQAGKESDVLEILKSGGK